MGRYEGAMVDAGLTTMAAVRAASVPQLEAVVNKMVWLSLSLTLTSSSPSSLTFICNSLRLLLLLLLLEIPPGVSVARSPPPRSLTGCAKD